MAAMDSKQPSFNITPLDAPLLLMDSFFPLPLVSSYSLVYLFFSLLYALSSSVTPDFFGVNSVMVTTVMLDAHK